MLNVFINGGRFWRKCIYSEMDCLRAVSPPNGAFLASLRSACQYFQLVQYSIYISSARKASARNVNFDSEYATGLAVSGGDIFTIQHLGDFHKSSSKIYILWRIFAALKEESSVLHIELRYLMIRIYACLCDGSPIFRGPIYLTVYIVFCDPIALEYVVLGGKTIV